MSLFHHEHRPTFLTDPMKYFDTDKIKKEEAIKRYHFFKEFFEKEKDRTGEKRLLEVKNHAAEYIESIVNFEFEAQAFRKGKISKYDLTSTDLARKIAHDSLISSLKSFNKYCSKKYGWVTSNGIIPVGGLFTLDPAHINNRDAIRMWAWLLISELFKKECKNGKRNDLID